MNDLEKKLKELIEKGYTTPQELDVILKLKKEILLFNKIKKVKKVKKVKKDNLRTKLDDENVIKDGWDFPPTKHM